MAETAPLLERPRTITVVEQDRFARQNRSDAPMETDEKLGTLDGVFLPTTLNVLSILMFLRFAFIIGQAGVLGTLLLFVLSYSINTLTVLSISAIATNGIVRGGGAYYMISRSLGPEFGGSIGVVFYIGQILNAGLNIAGFTEPLVGNFGRNGGYIAKVLPEGTGFTLFYESLILLVCVIICFVGPSLFARSSRLLFVLLFVSTLSIPISTLFVKPYFDPRYKAMYTGPSWETLKANFAPCFTKGAAGSELQGKETWKNLFGILFPATAGIFAGASMSGDLLTPSKSIPKGTLWGLALTVVLYLSVILSIASTVSRPLLHRNEEILRDINASPIIIVIGEFSTSLFSALMGVTGAAKLLQAVAQDGILPFIDCFAKGSVSDDTPVPAILLTWLLTQLTIFLPINRIAVYITDTFLMTFIVTNLACFLLDISSAPNFRPSFRYFNAKTAGLGTLASVGAALMSDGLASSTIFVITIALFILIHFYSPPKPWGDVSQSLIYHQVRKYLLRLRQDHVKYWRPQILLLVDDPRTCWSLIKFCSHVKKGGLFILGHVIVTRSNVEFAEEFDEIEKQRDAWVKLRDACKLKAFVQIATGSSLAWGVRNMLVSSGLGGMRPNITVLGFYDPHISGGGVSASALESVLERVNVERLPTDDCRQEDHLPLCDWVCIIEDLLIMKGNVAVAQGFSDLEIPSLGQFHESKLSAKKGFIDLYPFQMSANDFQDDGASFNFNTYTMILQLGAILHTVPVWKKTHYLRVVAFVERNLEADAEKKRISVLLDKLRIPAEVLVVPLETGNHFYDVICQGSADPSGEVNSILAQSSWWARICRLRSPLEQERGIPTIEAISRAIRPRNPNQQSKYILPDGDRISKKRHTLSFFHGSGISPSITHVRQSLSKFYSTDFDSDNSALCSDSDGESSSVRGEGESNPHNEYEQDQQSEHIPLDLVDTAKMDKTIKLNAPSKQPTNSTNYEPYQAVRLTFNELPAKAQHLVLNHHMRNISKESAVLFSTLPAPALGTHKSEESSAEYHSLIASLCNGLPPIVLINSQSMTVTTSL